LGTRQGGPGWGGWGARGRDQILGRNWSSKSFPPCYSQLPLLTDFYSPPPPLSKSALKLVCNVNIVYGNLKTENSQAYAQRSQRNCTFMNSASGQRETGRRDRSDRLRIGECNHVSFPPSLVNTAGKFCVFFFLFLPLFIELKGN
jgi:hypothetical protein